MSGQAVSQQQLVDVVREKALEFGDFTLASGKKANFYLDCRKVTMDSESAPLIAEAMIDRLPNPWPDAVGGMAVGAVPIAAAILARVGMRDRALKGFFVRKEQKDHGTNRRVEGSVSSGDRVVIVEDVVTSGGSSLDAIRSCREFGLVVEHVIAIVDRQAGAAEAFAQHDCQLTALMTVADLGVGG